jgi:hypothetical protein
MERLHEKLEEKEANTIKRKSKKASKNEKKDKLLHFKALYSLNLGSKPDGSAKESYKEGKMYSFYQVKDKNKIDKLKKLKII